MYLGIAKIEDFVILTGFSGTKVLIQLNDNFISENLPELPNLGRFS